MRGPPLGLASGPEWSCCHDLVNRAAGYVVDEAGDDQLVWCSRGLAEPLNVVLHGNGGIGDRYCRHFVDTLCLPVACLLIESVVIFVSLPV